MLRRLTVGRAIDSLLLLLVVALGAKALTRGRSSPEFRSSVVSEATSRWVELERVATGGDSAAGVRVVVFADYQCPACRQVHVALDSLRLARQGAISVATIPFPLASHSHAVRVANAAECAGEHGRFREFEDVAYKAQAALGFLPLDSLAVRAGVHDLAAFRACASSADTLPGVRRGIELASSLQLAGTPSIFVNGQMLTHIPSLAALTEYLNRVLSEHQP